MEAAVRELVQRRRWRLAELDQLPHPREVEEPVAADLAGDVPEQQPQERAREPHRAAAGQLRQLAGAGSRTAPRRPRSRGAARAPARATRGRRSTIAVAREDARRAPRPVWRRSSARPPPAPGSRPARARARSRRRAGRAGRASSSLDQRADVAGADPAGGVAVHRPPLAADDTSAKAKRPVQHRRTSSASSAP